MEQYKLINAQLMDQVQSQRKMIGLMREEEVNLKRRWMEEREQRLAEAQYNENKLKCGIRTLLRSLDMNLNLDDSISSSIRTSQASENARRSSGSNCNRICSEFRRSSILLQSSVPTSPTNRNHSQSSRKSLGIEQIESLSEATNNTSIEAPIKTPEPRRLNELPEYSSSPEMEDIEEEQTVMSPAQTNDLIYSIIEESDSEDVSFTSTVEYVEPQQERVLEDRKKPSPLPLRDVTNKSSRLISSPKNTKLRSNSASITRSEATKDIQETTTGHVRRAPQQRSPGRQELLRTSPKKTTVRGKPVIVSENETNYDNLEPSIEYIRHATRPSSPVLLTIPGTSVNNTPNLTPRRSQLNFDRFNSIMYQTGNCSTPRLSSAQATVGKASLKSKKKIQKSTSNSTQEYSEQLSSESTLSGRPSRKCRPTSLKEATLNSKMRRE